MRIYFTHAQNFHKPITYRTIRRLEMEIRVFNNVVF